MLDDCKGERLEEVLAVFSHAVLKKVVRASGQTTTPPIAEQLAFENFSYSGERTALSNLILAHKVSLRSHLKAKNEADARYHDFADLLNLNERRITRRHEQLKEATQDHELQGTLSTGEVYALQDQVTTNWSGREEWLEAILYGNAKVRKEDLLSASFNTAWRHVEAGSIGDIEERTHAGLLEQLEARLKNQETRLAKWQDFGKSLKSGAASPSKTRDSTEAKGKNIDLGFNLHQNLHINHNNPSEAVEAPAHHAFTEYTQLIETMKDQLAAVGKPTKEQLPTSDLFPDTIATGASLALEMNESNSANDEWTSASDAEETQPNTSGYSHRSPSPSDHGLGSDHLKAESSFDVEPTEMGSSPEPHQEPLEAVLSSQEAESAASISSSLRPRSPQASEVDEPNQPIDSESELADQILDSVSALSPSPKKSRHTLSLAERTRLSMSRASHSHYSELHDDIDAVPDLPRLSLRPRSPPPRASLSSGDDKHADLIERTRQSMVGFEAAQKKAQIERRRSLKDAKKKQRESNYFPRVEEEQSRGIDPTELIEGDPDYESVFKSRPKIKTSPAVSPTRAGSED